MGKDYRTEDGAQIAPLSELKDFQVSEGYKDIRGWRVDSATGRILLVAVLDNLVKGAAGQAIQNFNVMLGLDERSGLLPIS